MDIKQLVHIAEKTNQIDLKNKLEQISLAYNQVNAPLMLPLVGEFSSGKTTLINALTDCKKLETATKPTTATIYEIFFGNESCSASIVNADGSTKEINIDNLKNDELKDALIVDLFDTSTKISSSTILVDTPGLSSPDPKHRQVLLEFIPKADGILLVTDINQQITKSLVDFTKSIALTNRPVYLIITKCDTKSESEIAEVKQYILNNSELNIKDISCVSANNDDLNEIYELLKKIDSDKTEILKNVNEQRVKNIAKTLLNRINELINSVDSTETLDEKIKDQKRELEHFKRNIDRLINDVTDSITGIETNTCYLFQNTIFERLENLLASSNIDLDAVAASTIQGVSSQLLGKYKTDVQSTLYSLANERRGSDLGINLQSLTEIDYSSFKISDIPYNLNLNTIGHQYDGFISGGVKLLAVAGLVVGTIATAGALAPAAAGGAAAAGTAGSAIATGIAGSIDAIAVAGANAAMNRSRNKELQLLRQQQLQENIRRQQQLQNDIQNGMEIVENYNTQIGNKVGQKQGLVEGVVSKITDKTGKPQRQRALHNYIDDSLLPEFKFQMQTVSQKLITLIQESLNREAEELIIQKSTILQDLKDEKDTKLSEFTEKIENFKEYKNLLESL